MAIVVVGTVFVDIKGFPEDIYIPGGRNAGSVQIVHGGVGRNVAEDIANVELRPVFVSMVDDTAEGGEVLRKLRNHRVNTDYVVTTPDGMGMWLAVFDETGDVVGSISKRPKMDALAALLDEKGDEIFADADSIIIEIDLDKSVVKRVLAYARKYHKKVYAVVANMSIATQRRDFLQDIDCFICNVQEAGILFVRGFLRALARGAVRRPGRKPCQRGFRLHGRHDGQPRRGLRLTERRARLFPARAASRCAIRPARATPSAPAWRSR